MQQNSSNSNLKMSSVLQDVKNVDSKDPLMKLLNMDSDEILSMDEVILAGCIKAQPNVRVGVGYLPIVGKVVAVYGEGEGKIHTIWDQARKLDFGLQEYMYMFVLPVDWKDPQGIKIIIEITTPWHGDVLRYTNDGWRNSCAHFKSDGTRSHGDYSRSDLVFPTIKDAIKARRERTWGSGTLMYSNLYEGEQLYKDLEAINERAYENF